MVGRKWVGFFRGIPIWRWRKGEGRLTVLREIRQKKIKKEGENKPMLSGYRENKKIQETLGKPTTLPQKEYGTETALLISTGFLEGTNEHPLEGEKRLGAKRSFARSHWEQRPITYSKEGYGEKMEFQKRVMSRIWRGGGETQQGA